MNEPKRFLRLPAVMDMVGLKRTVIYERMKAGTFPAQHQIGARAVAWDEQELAEWQKSLARGSKKAPV